MRRHVLFPCDGSLLAGTIDEAPGKTGLLIVSGGNEVRSGAWGSQAQLAAAVAAAGCPVYRFDRRGSRLSHVAIKACAVRSRSATANVTAPV